MENFDDTVLPKKSFLPRKNVKIPSKSPEGNSVVKSKILFSNVVNQSESQPNSKFDFELLRIKSKEFRYSLTIDSLFPLFLFGLALFIVGLIYQYSSSKHSFLCVTLKWAAGKLCCCWKTSNNSGRSAPEKYAFAHFFSDRDKKLKKSGFNRVPQNENDVLIEDDDEEEDEMVLEDFRKPKGPSKLV